MSPPFFETLHHSFGEGFFYARKIRILYSILQRSSYRRWTQLLKQSRVYKAYVGLKNYFKLLSEIFFA
jgi:hypothetical protein